MPAPQAKTPSTTTPSASAPSTGSTGAKSPATSPAIPAAHTPTPAQQNPNVRRPLAPYLPEANPNAPPDPQKAFADRQREAINSRLKDGQKTAVAASGVDPQTSKPGSPATPVAPATKETKASTALDSLSKEAAPEAKGTDSAGSEPPSPEATSSDPSKPSESAPRGPRYEVKAMKKWAEENPDAAAEIAVQVFGKDQDSTSEWIRIQNKKRKLRGDIRTEREQTVSAAKAEREAAATERTTVENHRKAVQPLVDLFQAGARRDAAGNFIPDYDAVEAAFEQCTQGLKLDDFMRMRARRGVSSPETARLRAENARQAAELAALKPKEPAAAETPAAAPAAKVEPPARPGPTVAELEEKWGEEIDAKHPLRQFNTWAKDLEKAMHAYHDEDLDEYSRDPEDVAGDLLKKKLAEFAGEEEPAAPAPKAGKPKIRVKGRTPAKDELPSADSLRPKVSTSRSTPAEDDDAPPDFRERERRAYERHQLRVAGKLT